MNALEHTQMREGGWFDDDDVCLCGRVELVSPLHIPCLVLVVRGV